MNRRRPLEIPVRLRLKGFHLSIDDFGTGHSSLAQLRKARPDLILMDIAMPELDGLETTRRLKSIPGLAQVPVIMVTGKSEGSIVMDGLHAGASAFVVKPFGRPSLISKVAKALRSARLGVP